MASFSVLTAFWIIKTSQAKERSKEKQRENEENRGQQLQSYFALLEHFLKTIFSILIPFQSSGSLESNASNRVQFGAEMRKIWPSEDNCIMPNDQFRKEIFLMVRNLAISHHEEIPCESFARRI